MSYFPLFCGHDIFCLLPGAAEPQILDFVHSGPESQGQEEDLIQLSSCHCQLSAEGRLNANTLTLLTLPPCTVLSAHLWSPLTFSGIRKSVKH